ncbi:MAG: hypothetical protein NXH88_14015 [Hyphomonas sp.]|nr:hypothetical protein [Hyphomonas sp.]
MKNTLNAILFVGFVLALVAVPYSIAAQEPDANYKYGVPPLDIETYEIFDGRVIELPAPTSISPEFLDEMQYNYAECKLNDLDFGPVDCGCRAMNFLKTRMEMPEAHLQNVRKEAEKTHCYVPEKLRERYVYLCTNSLAYKRAASEEAGDAYCICYADEMTPQVVQLETDSSYGSRLRGIENQARKKCRL